MARFDLSDREWSIIAPLLFATLLTPERCLLRNVPSLRDIDRRYPYMHDGSEATLASVVAYYNRGGDVTRPSKAAQLRPLGLTAAEQADLLAFLGTLTGPPIATVVPVLPR